MIKIKRVYDAPSQEDGTRILVDRLWPRGLSKERAQVDLWLREIAPTHELRKWYSHDPAKWQEFKARYAKEMKDKEDLIGEILRKAKGGTITFLYGSTEQRLNNAVALKEYVEAKAEETGP
jgi:uncharacterized protein YeaO (DUF488 family)